MYFLHYILKFPQKETKRPKFLAIVQPSRKIEENLTNGQIRKEGVCILESQSRTSRTGQSQQGSR